MSHCYTEAKQQFANTLKHTPSGGTVVLRAAPHFWERRVATMAPLQERRRFRLPRPNSVEVSVKDSRHGHSCRTSSGAIAKRLIQAHRGKTRIQEADSRSYCRWIRDKGKRLFIVGSGQRTLLFQGDGLRFVVNRIASLCPCRG